MKAFGALLSNVDPDRVSQATIDWINQHPSEAGVEVTKWLANGCRLIVGEPKVIKLDPSKKFDPAEFIGAGWTIWKGPADGDGLKGKEEIDERSLALTEVDLSKVILETCLKQGESSIRGEEKLARFKALAQTIRLGGNAFLALWEDYKINKENSCLEWLRRNREVTYVDFMGLVLRNPHGDRCVLFLYFYGGRWGWLYSWLGRDWDARRLSAGLASQD
jgi:hypothetical protein